MALSGKHLLLGLHTELGACCTGSGTGVSTFVSRFVTDFCGVKLPELIYDITAVQLL